MPRLGLSLPISAFGSRSGTIQPAQFDPSILNLRFNGNFNDSSPDNVSMSASGGAAISTTIKKYGSGSVSMNSGRVSSAGLDIQDLSGTDWTIEGWVYRPTNYTANRQSIVNLAVAGSYTGVNIYYFASDGGFVANDGLTGDLAGGTLPVGEWTHFAVTWNTDAGQKTLFLDGSIIANGEQPALEGPYVAHIGNISPNWGGDSFASNIYIDSIRITPSLVYTGEFDGDLPGEY